MWKIKTLEELSSLELLEILRLRIDTFVIEQERIYHEVDDKDLLAYHIFYHNPDTQRVEGYARVFQTNEHVTFGRVVISKALRGTGQGTYLMEQVLDVCRSNYPNQKVEIESQEQVVPFYEKFGFEVIGEPFIFEGSPHVEMQLIQIP
ncbi:GNAT family N-acetyltransferase [Enterococcus olivae]